jgi:hypothetical protein
MRELMTAYDERQAKVHSSRMRMLVFLDGLVACSHPKLVKFCNIPLSLILLRGRMIQLACFLCR